MLESPDKLGQHCASRTVKFLKPFIFHLVFKVDLFHDKFAITKYSELTNIEFKAQFKCSYKGSILCLIIGRRTDIF